MAAAVHLPMKRQPTQLRDAQIQGFGQRLHILGEMAKALTQSRGEIKRVIAEGDLVVLHVHRKNTPDDLGRAVIDIFRLDKNGKIVEHWDVSQPVPEKTASGRSMF